MKKNYLRLLSVLLCALFCSSAFAERLAYGFVVDDIDGSGDKFLCSFNPNLLDNGVNKIQDHQGFNKPLAGTYAEDTYYLISQDASSRQLYLQKVSLKGDKDYEKIGDALTVSGFVDMAYDVNSKTMYAITGSSKSDLYVINLTTGVPTKKATLDNKYQSMTCSPEGQLYGVTWLGNFLKINLNGDTATETPVKNDALVTLDDGTINQSLDFDTATNTLYWAYTDAAEWTSSICKLDPETGNISDKKEFPNGEQIIGLCFAEVGGDEPIDPPMPVDGRQAYGFSLYEEGEGPAPFTANKAEFLSFNANGVQEGTTVVKPYTLLSVPQAASYVVDKDSIYLIGQDADGLFLYRMDKNGENYTRVSSEPNEAKFKDIIFKDMAYDAMNKALYAIADSSKEGSKKDFSLLYKFDLKTGLATQRTTDAKYLAIAFLKSGQAMGITEDGEFCIIYLAGSKQKVASLDTSLFDPAAPMDMEFDLSTLTLYWSYTDKKGKGHMAIIDPATGKVSNDNAFKDREQVIGLYFPTVEIEPSATWYAFSMFSNTHDEDNGFVSFDPANLASVTPIGSFNTSSIAAAAGANGTYYAARTEPNGYGARATNLATVNLQDGTMTNIAPMDSKLLLWDMTYDYSTGNMYGISMEGDPDPAFVGSLLNTYCQLYSMDLKTYKWELIARLDTEYRGIACTMDGQLYAVTQKGVLCKVNKLTGAVETVMETKITFEPTFPASMEFDHANEALYCTYFTEAVTTGSKREPSKAAMSQFDLIAKQVVNTRIYPGKDKLCGLYIPFERAASIPAKVADLTVTPGENGALTATLAWTNPGKTYGNEDLAAITKVEVLRDGSIIATLDQEQTPGKANTYTDEQVPNGFHNYSVIVYNNEEASEPAAVLKFIGEDVPAAPTNVVLTSDGGSKATITWEAPTIGLNTGWFNPANLKYKVVRQPDNKILTIDYVGTSIEDVVPMMNYYTYHVIATSTRGEGGEGVSNSMTVGTAFVPPYSCDFMNEAEAGLWKLTGTWKVDNFGMGENYRGLIHGWEEKCDSWAYSPLIQFKNDKTYVLTFKARAGIVGPKELERVRITAGLDRTEEAQTVAIAEIDSIGGGNRDLVTYSVTFGMPTNDDYYLGFYCTSYEEINDEGDYERTYGELQISNITLIKLDIPYNSIDENEVMGDVFVYAHEGKVHINGEYTSAMVYNQLGAVCPMDATLAKGIYIVKVMNGNAAKTYKVLVK